MLTVVSSSRLCSGFAVGITKGMSCASIPSRARSMLLVEIPTSRLVCQASQKVTIASARVPAATSASPRETESSKLPRCTPERTTTKIATARRRLDPPSVSDFFTAGSYEQSSLQERADRRHRSKSGTLSQTSCCPRRCPMAHFERLCLRSQKDGNPANAGFPSYSGGRIRTCDLRVMSPNLGSRWTTWSTASSGFREIKLRGDRLESVGLLAPFLAPAAHEGVALCGRRGEICRPRTESARRGQPRARPEG